MTRPHVLTVAIALCLAAPVATAQDGEVEFNSGLSHLREGRTDLAIEAFKDAVRKDKKNSYFHKGLGQAYSAAGQFKKAVDAFEKALDLNPYYVDVRNDLGTALILAGRREEGLDQLLRAFNDPTNPSPELSSRNLGQAYFESGQYSHALNWYRTSLGRNENYSDAYLGVADCLRATGDLEGAILNLEVGVKRLPKASRLRLELGRAYFDAGRFSDARAAYEALIADAPASPEGRAARELLKRFPQ